MAYAPPNAGRQARRGAGAQRTLYAVACTPMLGRGVVQGVALPPRGADPVSLLGQEVQEESVESLRGFHIGHMPHARYHHLARIGDALM